MEWSYRALFVPGDVWSVYLSIPYPLVVYLVGFHFLWLKILAGEFSFGLRILLLRNPARILEMESSRNLQLLLKILTEAT